MKKVIALTTFAILTMTVGLQAAVTTTSHTADKNDVVSINTQSTDEARLYKQLCELNAGWTQRTPNFGILPNDERSTLIQTHLRLVIGQLERADVTSLTQSQRTQRLAHIKTLQDYMLDGVFPQNVFVAGNRPVFIDPWGTHCAVGHLIATSGNSQLAKSINDEHQLDYLRDIKTDGLSEWQAGSGLGFDELALIQPQYPWRNVPTVKVSYPKEIRALLLGDSSEIMKAIQDGDDSLLKARCGGKTILHFAAVAGDLKLVKFLIEQGADLSAVSKPGREKASPPGNKKPFSTIHKCQWNQPSQVIYAKGDGILLRGYFVNSKESYVANFLQDIDGGVAGKNALYFATKKQHSNSVMLPARSSGYLGKNRTTFVDTLAEGRSKVAKWLKEQGLK